MMLQLNPPLPVYVMDKGLGIAHIILDYGPEFNLFWVVALDDFGEIWTFDNSKVRLTKNITMGRFVNE